MSGIGFARLFASMALMVALAEVATAAPPAGIYSLGAATNNPNTPQDDRLSGIRSYDFVSGFTLRVFWGDIETAQGVYDFSVIDEAVRRTEAIGRGLNLEILMGEEPAYVLNGASATYLDHRGGTNPVPWDAFAQQRQAALYAALGSHVVQTASGSHPLNQDPTLKSIDAAPAGLNFGVRDINDGITSHPGYTRQRYSDAVVNGVAASTSAFPNHTNFLAFFAFTDAQPSPRADTEILQRLAALYNDPGQPELAFFIENLSDNGPAPGSTTGNNLAAWAQAGGTTMMQALDSWLAHRPDRDPQLATRNPATGIELAYDAYGTRFFELYIADLDGAATGAVDAAGRPLIDDLRYWNNRLTGVPEPAIGFAAMFISAVLGAARHRRHA